MTILYQHKTLKIFPANSQTQVKIFYLYQNNLVNNIILNTSVNNKAYKNGCIELMILLLFILF
jgi:hypothetical protein